MTTAAILAAIKRNPVRVATAVIAAVVVGVSLATGTPVAVILAQVAGVVATLEAVRRKVAPMVSVVVHAADLEEWDPVAPSEWDEVDEEHAAAQEYGMTVTEARESDAATGQE